MADEQVLVADYIEDYGTDGIWTWSKRASGIAEICCKYETEVNIPTTNNNNYNTFSVDYPFEFKEINDAHVTAKGGYLISAKVASSSTTRCSIICWCEEEKITAAPQTFYINIKGTWK